MRLRRFTGTAKAAFLASAAFCALSLSAAAQELNFDIPAEDAAQGIQQFGQEANLQIVISAADARGKRTNAVQGAMAPREALKQLLNNSDIAIASDDGHAIVLADQAKLEGAPKNVQAASNDEAASGIPTNVETVVVTGSRILGGDPAVHIKEYDRSAIDLTGAATLAEFAQTMPENQASVSMGGSQVGGSVGPDNSGGELNGGAGFNLHGLGPDATLTLLNGHRLAGSGSQGEYVDISMIPMAAVQRVEVLTDGASAVYGSDAVAGVVNVILRDDFDGAETSGQYRTTTRGGGEEYTASQILGTSWSGGHVMGVYQYDDQESLLASRRGFVPNTGGATNLLPTSRQNSLFLTGTQSIDASTTVSLDGMFSEKSFTSDTFSFGQIHGTGESHQYGTNIAVTHKFGGDWQGQLVGSYSNVSQRSGSSSDGGPVTSNNFDLSSKEIHADATGALFALPGGKVQVALGGEYREETNHNGDDIASFNFPNELSRGIGSLFAETHIPIVGEDNAVTGITRLEVSVAGRYDHYSDFGSAFSPHFGGLWSLIKGVDLRASYSQAYRAPRLDQLFAVPEYVAEFFPNPASATGKTDLLFNATLGNGALRPERSNTSTVGIDMHPEIVPGLDLSATYFDTRYKDQINTPPVTTTIFTPSLAPFLNCAPNASDVAAIFASGRVLSDRTHLGAAGVQCTFDDQITNLARTSQSGMEFEASYGMSTDLGRFTMNGAADWMLSDNYQTAAGISPVQLLNQFSQPLRFKLRGGLGWSRDEWLAGMTVNYANAYENPLATTTTAIGSWTTVDLHVAYAMAGDDAPDLLRGTKLGFTVQNLFDVDPPSAQLPDGFFNLGYDPVNANPLGRVISLKLEKTW